MAGPNDAFPEPWLPVGAGSAWKHLGGWTLKLSSGATKSTTPANRDRGAPHGAPPPTPPCIRITYTAVRLIESPYPFTNLGRPSFRKHLQAGRCSTLDSGSDARDRGLTSPIAASTPLLPKITPQAPPNPLLYLLKWARHLAEAIIRRQE
jgi:hypothetical protein